jgi:hypothetical protein
VPQPLKSADHVVYTGPRTDIGGVKTGTAGVVQRLSGDMAYVRWDAVEVHASSYKPCRYLSVATRSARRRGRTTDTTETDAGETEGGSA